MASSKTSVQTVALHVLVSGKVQGVGFRFSLAEQARALNIFGWCRNLPDGRVEAWLQGPTAGTEQILDWIRQGPAGCIVEDVQVENQAMLEPMLNESITAFEIRK